jgi:hypothetical protein
VKLRLAVIIEAPRHPVIFRRHRREGGGQFRQLRRDDVRGAVGQQMAARLASASRVSRQELE